MSERRAARDHSAESGPDESSQGPTLNHVCTAWLIQRIIQPSTSTAGGRNTVASPKISRSLGYKPDVKIKYVGEMGKKLTPKEAFQQLCLQFHGKGCGKMNTDWREEAG
jgi:hypothetical protein